MCVVEVEGSDRLAAACDTPVEEGLVVHTNTPKVRKARRVNMELLLSQHASYCSHLDIQAAATARCRSWPTT